MAKSTKKQPTYHLVVSDEKQPKVALRAGMRLDVVKVSFVDPGLRPQRFGASRLCGGTSTCLALMLTDGGDPAP